MPFDTETRTFRGTVEWAGDASRTINGGDARWVYEMTFSESLNIICGTSTPSWMWTADDAGKDSFPSDSCTGGALLTPPRSPAPPLSRADGSPRFVHFEAPGGVHQLCAHAPEQWLLDDGTRPLKKPFLSPRTTRDAHVHWGDRMASCLRR